jgi:hypothetical protein
MTLHFNWAMLPVFIIVGLGVLVFFVVMVGTLVRHRLFWYHFTRGQNEYVPPPAPTPQGGNKVVPFEDKDNTVVVGSTKNRGN